MENSAPAYTNPNAVIVFADYSSLVVSTVDELVSLGAEVFIVCNDEDKWKEKNTNHLFHIVSSNKIENSIARYILVFEGFSLENKKLFNKDKNYVDVAEDLVKRNNGKGLLILPTYSGLNFADSALRKIYVGDLLSESSADNESQFEKVIKEAFDEEYLPFLSDGKTVCATRSQVVAKRIVKELFGYVSDKTILISNKISSGEFNNFFAEQIDFSKRKQVDSYFDFDINVSEIDETHSLVFEPLKNKISEIKKKSDLVFSPISIPIQEPVKIDAFLHKSFERQGTFNWIKIATLSLAVLLIILSPFIAFGVSALALKKGVNKIMQGNPEKTKIYFGVSEVSSAYSTSVFTFLSNLPSPSRVKELASSSNAINSTSHAAKQMIMVSDELIEFGGKVLGTEPYDINQYADKLAVDLESLYKETSFIEADLNEIPFFQSRDFSSITEARSYLLAGSAFFQESKDILGYDAPKTYLVLFQNNMELRPTGGFIGSFALVTFDRGRMIDFEVQDVYSADGQLQGHVEPPQAISEYLGEANWYLRDSNWNPDFPQSAQNAEWFLDKEIERQVDGVIGIDLSTVRDLIRATGPVMLYDSEQEITADNLYERVQYEVENDFFPGSRKKASLLTELSKSLLNRLRSLSQDEYFKVGEVTLKSLKERHLQIYLHNLHMEKVLSQTGWNGEVSTPDCADNCEVLWLGTVEANVGVNKANYFVSRNAKYDVNVEQHGATHTLTVNFTNNASTSLGLKGRYKNYFRVITSPDVEFDEYMITGGDQTLTGNPDTEVKGTYKEAGVLVEVPPSQTRSVTLTWEQQLNDMNKGSGSIMVYWRKQAGVDEMPVSVNIHAPLTGSTKFSYNTTLAKDLRATFNY